MNLWYIQNVFHNIYEQIGPKWIQIKYLLKYFLQQSNISSFYSDYTLDKNC